MANRMRSWMVRSFISREANTVLKAYKTLISPQIEYSSQAWDPVSRHGNYSVIVRLEGIQRRVIKIIKRIKDYSYRERITKLKLTSLQGRRITASLTETFKIINGIFNYARYFLNISPRTENLLSRQISKRKSASQQYFC